MRDRVGRWGGAPIRGVEPALDDADPTGGRHAFDQDAALTPIFTTLRRGGWRRHRPQPSSSHRPQSAPRPLRPVPDDAMTRFRNDPLTAPLPVVPEYAVDADQGDGPRPAIDPYAPASFVLRSPSPSEVTTWWRSPFAAPADQGIDHGHGGAPAHDPAPYGPPYPPPASAPVYDPAPYDPAAYYDARYDDGRYDARYDGARYDDARYDPAAYYDTRYDAQYEARYDEARYDEARYDEARYDEARYDSADHHDAAYAEPVPYDIPRRNRRFYDPMSYDPVTDSGRHHRRLAPAGW